MADHYQKGALVLLALLAAVLFFPTGSVNAAMVQPGSPEEIIIKAPPTARAGSGFSLRLQVMDSEGNIIDNYDETGRVVELRTDGHGELSRTEISASEFENGSLTLSLNYNLAEQIRVIATEQDHVAAGKSEPVDIQPGKPESFSIETPEDVRAGSEFSVTVAVEDAYGNRVERYGEKTNGLSIGSTGQGQPEPDFIPSDRFKNGRASLELKYNIAEESRLVFEDRVRGIEGRSEKMTVAPGELDEFVISVPEQVTVGEKFRLALEARDRFGNTVSNYSSLGSGVEITSAGSGSPKPGFIPAADFEDGVVFTELVYNRAEMFRLNVEATKLAVESRSNRIRANAGELARLKIETPGSVTAGEEFEAYVTALDTFGNRIGNYRETGDTLVLYSRKRPSNRREVPAGLFSNGRATALFSDTVARGMFLVAEKIDGRVRTVSEEIEVAPGAPGGVEASAPSRVKAGEPFDVQVDIKDEFGNQLENVSRLQGAVRLELTGFDEPRVKVIEATDFTRGGYRAEFVSEEAGTSPVHVEYEEQDLTAWTPPINIRPAEFRQVELNVPDQVRAGDTFHVVCRLLDEYGNPISRLPDNVNELQLRSDGSGELSPREIPESRIKAPSFRIPLRYLHAEVISIRVVNGRGRKYGSSTPLSVVPAVLSGFDLETPRRVRAGRSFPVRVTARDRYGNPVDGVKSRDGNLSIISNRRAGDSVLTELPFREFLDARAQVSLSVNDAGPIQVGVRSDQHEKFSDTFVVQPASPGDFRVDVPEQVTAGRPFVGRIRIYDGYGNLIRNLPSDFPGVRLYGQNSTRVYPRLISPELFQGGEARVYWIYPKTGRLDLRAEAAESASEKVKVSRPFVHRTADSGVIHLVFSGSVEPSLERRSRGLRSTVAFAPAELTGEPSQLSYDRWFVKRISQRQTGVEPLLTSTLSIYPRSEIRLEKSLKENLFTLEFNPVEKQQDKLEEIQSLIESEKYGEAEQKLEDYLKENPDDSYANRLRHRLDRIREVLEP